MIYGYARISTPKQNIERQVRNIFMKYPAAHIVKEIYTGTKFQGRKELEKILGCVKAGDTIVFDSVSRMSRNADEGFLLYQELYLKDINLVFLKEPHIDTDTYKKERARQINLLASTGDPAADALISAITDAINQYILSLVERQIRLAFEQSQKEVDDLRQRTSEGIQTARLNGKQIGQRSGAKLQVKKAVHSKEKILRYHKDFGGTLGTSDMIKLLGISEKSFYKYKRELEEENE